MQVPIGPVSHQPIQFNPMTIHRIQVEFTTKRHEIYLERGAKRGNRNRISRCRWKPRRSSFRRGHLAVRILPFASRGWDSPDPGRWGQSGKRRRRRSSLLSKPWLLSTRLDCDARNQSCSCCCCFRFHFRCSRRPIKPALFATNHWSISPCVTLNKPLINTIN